MADSQKQKETTRVSTLGDVVAGKEPVLHPQESIQEAGEKMRALEADALPVSEGRHLVGMIDQSDVDRRAAGYGHDPKATSVSDYMNSDAAYCFDDDNCAAALHKMEERQVDRLPVVDREMRIVGVVTRADLVEQR